MKRMLALVLAIVMVISLMPTTFVSAQTADTDRVADLVANMSLRDKVTQMMMVDFRKWGETAASSTDFTEMNDEVRQIIEDYNFGSIILFSNNIKETEQSYDLTMAMQEAAIKDGGLALIICADQEGGSVYRLGSGTALPGNMALGATYAANGTKYALEAGKIIGSELDAVGINGNLAPVVDVNNNANNPVIGLRSYSDDATIVGELASASIAGMAEYNVIGCAKHFPGHGDTATDSHYGLPMVDKSLEVLKEVELKPYEVAIDQGIEMIMTAHILYPQLESDKIVSNKTGEAESLPATMSDDILTKLLKEEMGFEGIIVTDAMNMAGISDKWDQVQSVVIAVNAGVDLFCMPCQLYCKDDLKNLDAIIDGVIAAVESGEISMDRINDAVTRILTVKNNRGILDYDPAEHTLEKANAVVGSAANREMEREIAANAVTVVKNEGGVLPLQLTNDSKVLMMVPYNNERAQMLMAWNRAKNVGLIPAGAEVDYITFTKTSTIESLKEKLEWADTYIINSEISATSRYNPSGSTYWLYNVPNQICDYAAANGKTAIISSVDKPYDVQLYPNAAAIVAAYGCKGSSVDPTEALIGGATGSAAAYGPNIIAAVEVILGTYAATGKLPVNIPALDMESRTYSDDLVYERGHGLTYAAKEPLNFVDIDLLIGETESVELKGDLSAIDTSSVDAEVATVELTVTPGASETTLSANVTAIESGKSYVLYNKVAQKLVNNTSADASVGGGGSIGLALSSAKDSFQANDIWTITTTEGGYHVQDVDGKYMTVARGKAGVSDTAVVMSLDYDGNDWTIGENGEYLNDFGGAHTVVAGWSDINDVNSQWEIYEVVTATAEPTTTLTVTAIGVGNTYLTIGDVTYRINVACAHATVETIPAKEATCTETGLTEGSKCSVCDEILTEQEEVAALGHTEATLAGYAATCTADGLTDGSYCSVCDETLVKQEVIPATGHAYDNDTDADCNNCGEEREVEILDPNDPTVKSKWVKVHVDTETIYSATEGNFEYAWDGNLNTIWHSNWANGARDVLTGENSFSGTIDFTETYKINRFYFTNRQDSTDFPGYITQASLYVKENESDEWICVGEHVTFEATKDQKAFEFDAQNVRYVKFVAEKCSSMDMTNASGQTQGWVCIAEFDIGYEEVVEHEHSFGEWTVTKEATCTEKGEETRSCECGETETREVEALGHTEATLAGYAATCTADGLTDGTYCSVCDETLVQHETIPALGHTYDNDSDADCNRCGEEREVGPTEPIMPPEMLPDDSSWDIPLSDLTGTCGDYEPNGGANEGPAYLALDNNPATMWHTDWEGTSRENHWFQFEVSGEYTVCGLRYLPRQTGNSNGTITKYEIKVSDDGETWTTVAEGDWAADSSWKIAQFPGEKAKYVRLYSIDAVTDNAWVFASAAELRLAYLPDVVSDADKTALNALIAECEQIEQGNYTNRTWQKFQNALEKAQSVSANPYASQAQVDEALAALQAAKDGLKEKVEGEEIVKVLHLDSGRKYFSKDFHIALINELAAAGYTHVQLAFGNNGLRFVLDDMSIEANDTTYASDDVKAGIKLGNDNYGALTGYTTGDAHALTESEMDEIIAHGKSVGIEIIPHLNMPGHMSALLDAMEYVGIENPNHTGYSESDSSVDLTNEQAMNFMTAIVHKYAKYFSEKGVKYFHIGADEYANDAYGYSMGFPSIGADLYQKFADFVNANAAIVKSYGMTPIAWNDGINYGSYTAEFDPDIVVDYWSSGWGGYTLAKASTLDGKGHGLINTNGDYYYILGKDDRFTPGNSSQHDPNLYTECAGYDLNYFMDGSTIEEPVGGMFCIWADYPGSETEQDVAKNIRLLLRAMALRMEGLDLDNMNTDVVEGGFNEDGSINGGEAPACKHTNTETRNAKNATCTEAGYTGDTYCVDCDEKIAEGEEIAALGHDFINGECDRCDEVLTSVFEDVHAGDYYFDPVEWAVEKGITEGATDTTFEPGKDLLRAQFVTFLWRAAGCPKPETTVNPFNDVKEGDFFYDAVLWAVENEITDGVADNEFGAYMVTNRAQAVTFLWRYLDNPEATATNNFDDVVDGEWYEAAINWAVGANVTDGVNDTQFGIALDCIRGQAVTFLYRAIAEK